MIIDIFIIFLAIYIFAFVFLGLLGLIFGALVRRLGASRH